MKILLLLGLVFAATQASPRGLHNAIPKVRTMPPVAEAPTYESAKIIGGQSAHRGQFPYQVAMYMDASYFCGGSIISDSWILTAAHCASHVRSFEIFLGALDLSDSSEGHIVVAATDSIVHQSYNSHFLQNDIAVVSLPSPITFDSNISPVSLPSRSQIGETFEGQNVRVSGWGKTSDSSTSISMTLNYVDLTIIPNADCAAYYGSTIIDSTICTDGGRGTGTCNGDSGGPLVISQGGTTQIGVVSFVASAGCESGAPAGFARVTSFLDWIQTNTGLTLP